VASKGDELTAIHKRFSELYAARNYPAALAEAQKYEAAVKAKLGTAHPSYGTALNELGIVYHAQGKYGEAEEFLARALTIYERSGNANLLNIANTLTNLGNVERSQAKYSKAEPLYKRALAIREKAPGQPNVSRTLDNLAVLYRLQGKYSDAEELLKRALNIQEKALGGSHPDVAATLNGLALVYRYQGKYSDAEELFKRALNIKEKALGGNHRDLASSLNNLALVYQAQAKYSDAEGLFKRALAINEKALGESHPSVAVNLDNLAVVYLDQGKYSDAEELFKRALNIQEKALGESHPLVATSLGGLARVYRDQGKYSDAEGLFKRALNIKEKALGDSHPEIAASLNDLARVYRDQRKYSDAEELNKRALNIQEKALGESHPSVAATLGNLAEVYRYERKYSDAEGLFKRALGIQEKALGESHPEVATTRHNLALVYRSQGKYSDAAEIFSRALAIYESSLGESHPNVAIALENLAILYSVAGKNEDSLTYSRRAASAVIAFSEDETVGARRQDDSSGLVERRADYFRRYVASLAIAARRSTEAQPALAREAMDAAQWANHSSAGAALAQMSARFASGNGALTSLIRERQDLSAAWRDKDKMLVDALGKPGGQRNGAQIEALRKQVADIERRRMAVAARLEKEFRDYAALSSPKSLKAEEVQRLLGPDEALVFFLAGDRESYVFALTREAFDWKTIPLSAKSLSENVGVLRLGLDVAELTKSANAGKPQLFDVGLAHQLYAALLEPVEELVKTKHHLMIVPTGPLTGLPFHLLVTETPATPVPQLKDIATYRDAAWLIKRQAVSVLPSVASLQALRVFAHAGQAAKPMIGFGDPVFDLAERELSSARQRADGRVASATRAYSEFWQGASLDRTKLSKALPSLPDTADELKAVAARLGASASDIHLGADASETTVKHASLADYRVVYFATHGLVAGDVEGLGEPSLALTLPAKPTELDDGLLTASEVAQLKLNADWVVLSACNTAAGDKPGAEALSGLARAFFYAGARALLVSHWSVASDAATQLTTSTFDIIKSDPGIGRAEALRQAMLAYMNDKSSPLHAYPGYWGPFSVIGEGAAPNQITVAPRAERAAASPNLGTKPSDNFGTKPAEAQKAPPPPAAPTPASTPERKDAALAPRSEHAPATPATKPSQQQNALVPPNPTNSPVAPGAPSAPKNPQILERKRVVAAEQKSRLEFLYSLNPDCSSEGQMVVRTSEPPQHGMLTIENGQEATNFPKDNQRFACNNQKSDGVFVFYQPAPGYTGTDSITVYVIFPFGTASTRHYSIEVK
jgi:tetratricopeptide (TPR) repeat protein